MQDFSISLIPGLNEDNSFLLDKICLSRTETIKRLRPVFRKTGAGYEFYKWQPETINQTFTRYEFASSTALLTQALDPANEVYSENGFTYCKVHNPYLTTQSPDGTYPPITAAESGNKSKWPITEMWSVYKMRDAVPGECSSILPLLIREGDLITNNTFINELPWDLNLPNGQNALQMKPMNFSWWLDLYVGGLPGDSFFKGTAMDIVSKARYAPFEFAAADAWSVAGGLLSEINKDDGIIAYPSDKGAMLRLCLVQNSGIYDNPLVSGEPKSNMYECWINLHG